MTQKRSSTPSPPPNNSLLGLSTCIRQNIKSRRIAKFTIQRAAARARRSARTTPLGICSVTWYALARTKSIRRCGAAKLKLSHAWWSCSRELNTVGNFWEVPPIRIGWFVWRFAMAVTRKAGGYYITELTLERRLMWRFPVRVGSGEELSYCTLRRPVQFSNLP